MKHFTLECCVDSVASARAAAAGGANRLELCANLIIGGTSPSTALFSRVREAVDLPIRVLLRPRFGDFLYTSDELAILRDEVRMFRSRCRRCGHWLPECRRRFGSSRYGTAHGCR